MTSIAAQIAQEIGVKPTQVEAAISLIDDGATVPFIARYRKEATQGLDDNHLRTLSQRLSYLRELHDRKEVVLNNIEQQGKLSAELRQQIEAADNKTRLEDLYLPFKPKRRTKGQKAIEAGLAPLAEQLANNWQLSPNDNAEKFINADAGYADVEAVLDGVSYILAEQYAEDAELIAKLRQLLNKQGHLTSKVIKSKQKDAVKYKDYFDHSERLSSVPSHRALAMLRGRNESFLSLSIDIAPNSDDKSSLAEQMIAEHLRFNFAQQAAAQFFKQVIQLTWKQKLSQSLETEALGNLREKAEAEAIKVFAKNLSDLLMAAPAGPKVTLGLDPGYRTGCKIAIVDNTGKLLQTATIFPHEPQNHWSKSVRTLVNLCKQHKVELIAIGNGTASRESDKLIAEVIKTLENNNVSKVIVSEAGASVYSASELAAAEFPDLDVSIRGAVSIARRLQDPLAELVKIDPKAIGVGQYQHDVSQSQLTQTLENVIEDCVNAVGVDVNSASAALLSHISGLNKTIAQNLVTYRDEHGRFSNRKELKNVARLGPKAFEQSAGFLRIQDGENPLDASGVHPETYDLADKIAQQLNSSIASLIANTEQLKAVDIDTLADSRFGHVTIKDVIAELEKPGRDPRPAFKTAQFKEGVEKIQDLEVGMILEGVVSNVANFGAFVDLGVHQDGLVHISAITDKFISDPRDVIKAGDIVKVKVTELDVERKRISLTMRLDDTTASVKPNHKQHSKNSNKPAKTPQTKTTNKPKSKDPANAAMGNAFADAFAKLKQ
ncbi:Tex family protein [Thalassotalea marina]|uniref:Transcription accessory protein n=1 Tax=Thalassotalea marina TaxID=1673741 RepID=A0A919BMP0_9GAMM|nr:Tex family protein [Thalassotalea marina]GHG00120.1 transcription accessory protein [Thalassotalea marina]